MTDLGTWGIFIENALYNFPFALSMELAWHDNKQDESCIPAGEYLCKRIQSPHFGEVFQIMDVPNRTDILIHKANWTTDLKGCIGIGKKYSETVNPINGRVVTSVLDSGEAFTELMAIRLANSDQFKLVIQSC